LWASLFTINFLLLGVAYPITRFTRCFIQKGLVVGALNAAIVGVGMWLLNFPTATFTWNLPFQFWLGFFTTMSFSGFTMDTSPREIAGEFVRFQVLNVAFLALGIALSIVGLLVT
jgi:hypothetical protein